MQKAHMSFRKQKLKNIRLHVIRPANLTSNIMIIIFN